MRWLAMVAIVLAVSAVFAYVNTNELSLVHPDGRPTEEELSQPVTSFSFSLVGHPDQRSLETYRGQVVLLNLWATWCAPCLEELPALNQLQEEHRAEGLVVITLSAEAPDHLAEFARSRPFSTVNGYIPDPEALPDPFRRAFSALPSSYVIDRQGVIQKYVLGSGTLAEWQNIVTEVLYEGAADGGGTNAV